MKVALFILLTCVLAASSCHCELVIHAQAIDQKVSQPKHKRLFTLQGTVAAETPEQNSTPLTIDLKRCAALGRSMAWGLGSETIEIKGLDKGRCVLQHFTELEGGYTRSECRVPTHFREVSIYWGGRSFYYSRDLSKHCKVIKTGNIFLDSVKPLPATEID
jgi:hypothetical protein